ncbi:glycosyltransferase [Polaribacter batillariae]|uniref:Glycosyltransferase n=1 Tax=Polaribacter batillariae TaxID=2808900 RepID=A0ABX7SXK4_9FLAO|nr:glycosyltransferase [Polaribacter batillariae]QTD37573.1 glycosyltransferase [Polaribacter batillariae]
MKFLIVSNAPTLFKNKQYFSYEPYVREINIWAKNSNTAICSPYKFNKELLIDSFNFDFKKFKLVTFSVNSIPNILKTLFILPINLFVIFKAMLWADHIHLRCPGNVGLLGCFVQILFPKKPKTVKYAGNWDPKSKQPLTYKLQKWILSNTFLTRNCKVLVYGNWGNQSKNIIPFFTASYLEEDIIEIPEKDFSSTINFIFVGTFSKGKKPMLSVKTVEYLKKLHYKVRLYMYGNGVEFPSIKEYIENNNLENTIFLHGNQSKETVKKAFQKAHFLIFISQSEGWPKVVAEAMFWKCLPISSSVSCVNYMLQNGTRGDVVDVNINEIELSKIIINYLKNEETYKKKVLKAQNWSQKFTLDKFEQEIQKLLSE